MARRTLEDAWQRRSAESTVGFRETDVVGALVLAGQKFSNAPSGRKILIVFSDMRNTVGVNLERPNAIRSDMALAVLAKQRLVPNLKGVEIYVLGVDDAGKSVAYWSSLQDFWTEYFKKTGGELRSYSAFRELQELGP